MPYHEFFAIPEAINRIDAQISDRFGLPKFRCVFGCSATEVNATYVQVRCEAREAHVQAVFVRGQRAWQMPRSSILGNPPGAIV